MNTITELLHIARKDALKSRWILVVFIAVVVLAAWRGAAIVPRSVQCVDGCYPASSFIDFILPVLTFAIGPLIAAILVQQDSPLDFNAFWKLQPVNSRAIFGAKFISISLALIASVVVAEFVSAFGHGIAPIDSWRAILHATQFYLFCIFAWSLLATIFADFKALLLASIGVLVLLLLFWILAETTPGFSKLPSVPQYEMPVIIGLAIVNAVLVLLAYVRRNLSTIFRVSAFSWLFVELIVVTYLVTIAPGEADFDYRKTPKVVRSANAAVLLVNATLAGRELSATISSTAPSAGHRLNFVDPLVEIVAADGTTHPFKFITEIKRPTFHQDFKKGTVSFSESTSISMLGQTRDTVSRPDSAKFLVSRQVMSFDHDIDTITNNGKKVFLARLLLISNFTLPESLFQILTSKGAKLAVSGFVEDQVKESLVAFPAQPGRIKLDPAIVVTIDQPDVLGGRALRLMPFTALQRPNSNYAALFGMLSDKAPAIDSAYSYDSQSTGVEYAITRNGARDTLPLLSWSARPERTAIVMPISSFRDGQILLGPRDDKLSAAVFRNWLASGQLSVSTWTYNSHALARAQTIVNQQK